MKLSNRDALTYAKRPDPEGTGALIYGADPMRVATRRQEIIKALIGTQGEEEMRLTRIPAGELRKDKAMLMDAIKAVGFFPGPRVAFVEDANDLVQETIANALSEWQPGDAQIIVSAGQLKATSKLRKQFEAHRSAVAMALYDDPPGPDEIRALCEAAGLAQMTSEANAMLADLARGLDPGDFRQTIEKLGLYLHDSSAPASPDDIAQCAPQSAEAAVDDLLAVVAGGQVDQIAALLRRLYAQGTAPVTLCIGAMRHFRTLHAAASDPGGAAAGIGRARPPVFGPRRDAMARQASQWGRDRLESAVTLLLDTDLSLRSAVQTAPARALVERALIRLAMMARARG